MKIQETDDAVRLHIQVQPRASRTELVGEHGDSIKIRVAAPPVDGEANEEVVRFLAKLVGIAPSRVRVVSGESSKRKTVELSGVSAAVVTVALTRALEDRR